MTDLTFRETPYGYVESDGARLYRDQCEELLDLWQREHDALLRIGSIEAICWARKISKSRLALSFAASLSFEDRPSAEVITFRGLSTRWPATPEHTGDAA